VSALKERLKEQKALNTALEERLTQLQNSNRAIRVKCASVLAASCLLPPSTIQLPCTGGSLAPRGLLRYLCRE
jgi:hypothetical protein